MSISFDAATSPAVSSLNASSLTFSHTTGGSLSNGFLIVGVSYYAAVVSVSSITYNGVNLTKVLRNNDGTHAAACELWVLPGPSAGANNVVITMSGPVGAGNQIAAGSITLSGVTNSTTVDAQTSVPTIVTGAHTSHTNALSTVANNDWYVDVLCYDIVTPSLAVSNASQTSRTNSASGSASGDCAMSTMGPVTPAGSNTLGWTFASTSSATAHSILALSPSGGTTFTQTCTETLTLTDSLPRGTTKLLSETVTLADTFTKVLQRTFTETLTLTDTLSAFKTKIIILLETLTFSDGLVKMPQKVLSETLTLTDTLSRFVSLVFSETLSMVDTVNKRITRTFTETITLSDTVTAIKGVVGSTVARLRNLMGIGL
jgi:hypothetical protein